MTIQTTIEAIRAELTEAEACQRKAARKQLRAHNMLAAALEEHGALLGLSSEEIVAFGGGTPKTDEPVGD